MLKSIRWRYTALALLTALSLVYLSPSLFANLPEPVRKLVGEKGLNLGLDLRGGIHLVLEVDLPKAVDNALVELRPDMSKALEQAGQKPLKVEGPDSGRLTFVFPAGADTRKATDTLGRVSADLRTVSTTTAGGEARVVIALKHDVVRGIETNSIAQALEVIRNRVDLFGVAEPLIVRQGTNQIVVQLPGIKDPQRAIDLIGRTAQLEFKKVSEASVDAAGLVEAAIRDGRIPAGPTGAMITKGLAGQIPAGTEVLPIRERDPQTGVTTTTYILLEQPLLMAGSAVKGARLAFEPNTGEAYVLVDFTPVGTRTFDQITAANVGKRLAIVLDGVVQSAPSIQERIARGKAQITGSFTTDEAHDLAIVLRAGALPAPVKIVQNLIVGPSLGRDSIRQGWISGLLGTALVVGFMIFYYRLSGVIANFALFLNVGIVSTGHERRRSPSGIAGSSSASAWRWTRTC
jgi:SecD/SecF fusion protein